MSNFSSKLKKNLNPAMGVALLALILAVTGVSFAATGGGGSGSSNSATASLKGESRSSAQAVALASKSKPKSPAKGPRGPKGATGATGPAGKNGANGTNGTPGAAGPQGPAGANGGSGESVSSTAIAPGDEAACEGKGGTEFTVAGKETFACNGKKGREGKEGPAGAIHPGETLPEGASEYGAWSFQGTSSSEQRTLVSISFPIPLAQALTKAGCEPASNDCDAHYVNVKGNEFVYNKKEGEYEEVAVPECKGSAADPTAEPGNLCVYETASKGFSEKRGFVETPLVLPPTLPVPLPPMKKREPVRPGRYCGSRAPKGKRSTPMAAGQ